MRAVVLTSFIPKAQEKQVGQFKPRNQGCYKLLVRAGTAASVRFSSAIKIPAR